MQRIQRQGRLRQRVQLQAQTPEYDDLGRQRRDGGEWATVASPFAEVLELSGNELEVARQKHAEATHSVEIRYRAGVTPQMRLLHDGRTLEIKHARDPDHNKRKLLLLCGEAK